MTYRLKSTSGPQLDWVESRFLLPDDRVGSVGLGSEGSAGRAHFVAGWRSLIEMKKMKMLLGKKIRIRFL